jgi:predicted nucleic acid-binding protein
VRAFSDSSALAKLYIREPGRAKVQSRLAEADELFLSVLALPEVMSALNRLRRGGKIGDDEYATQKQAAVADVRDAAVVQVTPSVVARAVDCLERTSLRASDAVHVASALEVGADLFLSADRRQCEAARAMGLRVERVPG